jgi:hypothetical protein
MGALRCEMRKGQVAGAVAGREPVDLAGGGAGIAQARGEGFEEFGCERLMLRGDKSENV